MSMIGQIIGHYKVISILGEGGMGIVYKALDMKLDRFVAIKILNTQVAHSPQFIERFKREAKNQAKFNCPNIIPVYGFVDERGLLGIAMEYVDGETLEKMILRKGSLEVGEAFEIIAQVLAGVGYAHQKGFIHRDIKPSNIIMNKEGVVKIMDFGISKSISEKGITKTGTKIGTLLYMSPEQINAQEPTKESDIYSIGVTLYEMIVGITPFEFKTEYEIMEGHLKKSPPKVSASFDSLPPEIDKMVLKSLEKEPLKRYHSCEEFLSDVQLFLNKYKVRKVEEPQTYVYKDEENIIRKNKFKLAIIALVLFLGALAVSYFFYNSINSFWPQIPKDKTVTPQDTTFSFKNNPNYFGKQNFTKLKTNTYSAINSIDIVDSKTVIACSDSGRIYRSTDSGESWLDFYLPDLGKYFSICAKYADNIFVVGEKGKIYTSSDMGENWNEIQSGTQRNLLKIYFYDRNIGFITGTNGLILKTTDKGKNWKEVFSGTDKTIFSVVMTESGTCFASGFDGTFLKSDDRGGSWQPVKIGSNQFIKDIKFFDGRVGIACGGNGEILRTENGGSEWSLVKSGVTSGLTSIGVVNFDKVFIASNKGEILKSTDMGKTWSVEGVGNFYNFNSVAAKDGLETFIGGINGVIVKLK